jgi:flagellar motor switch protein FliN/FliY
MNEDHAMTSTVVSRLDLPALAAGQGGKGKQLGERMDLVSHVKVKLQVSLGGAELSIDRLFSLTANDVIVLDRDADAPIDIRLNDKLIARGMLVAAGDKFGVRITEIQTQD